MACSDSQEKCVFTGIQLKAKPSWVSSPHARAFLQLSLHFSSATHQLQDRGLSKKPHLADGAPDPIGNLRVRKTALSAHFTDTASISNLQGLEYAHWLRTSQTVSKPSGDPAREKMVASGLCGHCCHLRVKLTFSSAISTWEEHTEATSRKSRKDMPFKAPWHFIYTLKLSHPDFTPNLQGQRGCTNCWTRGGGLISSRK